MNSAHTGTRTAESTFCRFLLSLDCVVRDYRIKSDMRASIPREGAALEQTGPRRPYAKALGVSKICASRIVIIPFFVTQNDLELTEQLFLQGQVALVTGGAARIGRAVALALAEHGATVALHYNSSGEAANRLVGLINKKGGRAAAFQAELSDDTQCVELVPKVNRALGTVRILVNNASLFSEEVFATTTLKGWDDNLDVNLRAPFRLSQAFAAQNGGRVRGRIIHFSDWRGLRPGKDHFAYTVSKAALIKMTESMALALAPRIRVNCLALGSILPPKNATRETVRDLIAAIPLGRLGQPRDVVAAMLYLLGPGTFVTGETILVDGGRKLVP
jgi:NAD(P)-dependent dehydrogenase (short-subunit alcohol dehydrogenase family)